MTDKNSTQTLPGRKEPIQKTQTTIVLTAILAIASSLNAQSVTLTNGPANPSGHVYIGTSRTNVLLCQAELDADATVIGSFAYGYFYASWQTRNPGGDRSISNIRCLDGAGNVIGYPYQESSAGLNDGTSVQFGYRIEPTIELDGFAVMPGTPTLISIVADLGPGYVSGDTMSVSWPGTYIYDLAVNGDFASPAGEATSSFTVGTDTAVIQSLTVIPGPAVELTAYGTPDTGYDVQATSAIGGSWQTITSSPVMSSANGTVTYDYAMVSGQTARFFRLVQH